MMKMKDIKFNDNILIAMKSLVLTFIAVFVLALALGIMRRVGLNIVSNALLVNALWKSLLVIVPGLIIRRYSKGNVLRAIGLSPQKDSGKYLFKGIGIGLICGMLTFGAIFLMKISFYEGTGFKFNSSKVVLAFIFSLFIRASVTGICEEVFFRGILLNYLAKYKGKLFGLLVSAIIFTAPHFTRYNRLDEVLFVFVGGITFGYLYIMTESLYMPIGLHFAIDFFMNLSSPKGDVGLLILSVNPKFGSQYLEESMFIVLSVTYLLLFTILILANKKRKSIRLSNSL